MRLIFLFIAGMFLIACGQQKPENKKDPNKIFLKKSLAGLAACEMIHDDCSDPEERCVEAPSYLGGTRQCIPKGELGEYFDCKVGQLIFHPSEPWQLDCLDEPN